MYDMSRAHSSLSEEDRNTMLDVIAEQRYEDFENNAPALTERGAPIRFDENTNPIGSEFGESILHLVDITQTKLLNSPLQVVCHL